MSDNTTTCNEVEAKWSVSERGFNLLLRNFQLMGCTEQLNVYFDENAILARTGATCRFRFEPQKNMMFTLKLPGIWSKDGTRTAFEIEMPANDAFMGNLSVFGLAFDVTALKSDIRQPLQALNVSRLCRVGRMRNSRHTLQLPSGGVFELDSFSLPGGDIRYEVEVEQPDAMERKVVVETVRQIVPDAIPSNQSKFQRFSDAVARRSELRLQRGQRPVDTSRWSR